MSSKVRLTEDCLTRYYMAVYIASSKLWWADGGCCSKHASFKWDWMLQCFIFSKDLCCPPLLPSSCKYYWCSHPRSLSRILYWFPKPANPHLLLSIPFSRSSLSKLDSQISEKLQNVSAGKIILAAAYCIIASCFLASCHPQIVKMKLFLTRPAFKCSIWPRFQNRVPCCIF